MKDKRVAETVARVLGVAPESIDEESSPETLGAWDSLKHMSLILALEEEFAVSFSDDEVVNMLSVGGIADVLQKKTRRTLAS
jgi:acyl carrier protein